jgi:hypothetical protein
MSAARNSEDQMPWTGFPVWGRKEKTMLEYDYYGSKEHYTGMHEIMYAIGRFIGLILMFGTCFVIGQVARGFVMALLYGPPA